MGLRLLVGDGFQVLFHSPPGVLFTFPSRYWFTIGGGVYLALEGGPPRFPQGSSCPVVLGYQRKVRSASRTGLSPAMARRSRQLPKTTPESLFLSSSISADLRPARSPPSVKREEQAPPAKREKRTDNTKVSAVVEELC